LNLRPTDAAPVVTALITTGALKMQDIKKYGKCGIKCRVENARHENDGTTM